MTPVNRACSVFVLFCVASLAAAGCGAPAAPVAQAQGVTTRWHTLGTWAGRGNRQTESFDVSTGALRLVWQARTAGSAAEGRLRVILNSAISGRPLQTIVDTAGAGEGTAYLEDDPRVSYLVIESDQVEWTVTLDEAVPTGH